MRGQLADFLGGVDDGGGIDSPFFSEQFLRTMFDKGIRYADPFEEETVDPFIIEALQHGTAESAMADILLNGEDAGNPFGK